MRALGRALLLLFAACTDDDGDICASTECCPTSCPTGFACAVHDHVICVRMPTADAAPTGDASP